MKNEILYAQLDLNKLKEINEKIDRELSLIEKFFFYIKFFIAEHLPEPLSEFMMGEIGDVVVIILLLFILSIVLKILGVTFKIIWRVFIYLLLLGSLYVLYQHYFS